ncbi:hypothetical protein OsJ_17537 [Oryza sativa Japonica Group]|uniref:Uncharacterized protein n=2 Tax=Oryza TaxID=4527 RepID=B9FN36_ORYSJ|nr:hypothetical protein OsJ_17537 [Oryza sativa Japonica Group]KAF2929661.1 hypothetical protein DAI22_05g072600 [Oryza sativa Japonica Group]
MDARGVARDGDASPTATPQHRRPGKAARGREEVLDLGGGHTAVAEVAWQGHRVMWDRVEVVDLAAGCDGG